MGARKAAFATLVMACTLGGVVESTAGPIHSPNLEKDSTDYHPPLVAVSLENYPIFSDDYDLQGMKTAIDRQLDRYKHKRLDGTIRMGYKTFPLIHAKESLEMFSQMIDIFTACVGTDGREKCYKDLNRTIREKFDVFIPNLTKDDPRYGQENFARFTGYHTHHIEGRLTSEGAFTHAIYANPRNTTLGGKTRIEIDFDDALAGLGLESVFSDQLFDIYLMQVEGSGRATIPQSDGSVKEFFLRYDGDNKLRWEFISKYMQKMGYISNGSIPAQRKFMREHPELAKEIYAQCPSYVYLIPTNSAPLGCDSVAVTPARTLATDNDNYAFKGLIAYIESQRPTENGHYDLEEEDKAKIPYSPFSRFLLDQDTGGAINGKARADIYFGTDEYAFFGAMHEDELGKIHFLMLK